MPRINDDLTKMVFYVYRNKEDAVANAESGGTGFLFSISSEIDENISYLYAVTNAHVVFDGDYMPILRINTIDGKFDIVETKQGQWQRHPHADDICVIQIKLNKDFHDYKFFQRDDILRIEHINSHVDRGVGDEVVMVGRFRVYAGLHTNLPTAMFGNIARMPDEPIDNPFTGLKQESYLVEMRSIAGFSGSPVILLFTDNIPPLGRSPRGRRIYHGRLMGICWGQISASVKAYDLDNKEYKIKLDSAMAAVVPISKLLDILDGNEMKENRKTQEKNLW